MNPSIDGADEAFDELAEIMAGEDPVAAKASAAMAIGTEYLDVENAHLTRIRPETDHWEIAASTDPPDGSYPPGLTTDLGSTFCRHAIERDDTLALHDVPNQGFADDVAYQTHDLGCYLGTPITVDGTLYGTVCFVDEDPRSDPFCDEEVPFVEILSRMLGYELEYRQREVELDRGSRLVDVFSRILRHNLRNDMTVVRGHVSRLFERLDQQPATEEAITATIDEMISLAEKARELEAIVRTEFDMQELSVPSLLEDSIADLESTYPSATFVLEVPEEATLFAMPTLETALHELLENAVKHAGDEPTCEVTVEAAPGRMTITVADDGPGLSNQEQRVLEDEAETPLVHGSGLGLWMVDWIVGGHDGTIETAVTETGTTITVSIPRPMLDGSSGDGWSA